MSEPHTIPFRPLGLIKDLLEGQGFTITHCYEDLVFVEHNAFLLRMEARGEDLSLIFNRDCEQQKRAQVGERLSAAALQVGLHLSERGSYTVSANDQDSTIDLEFFPG